MWWKFAAFVVALTTTAPSAQSSQPGPDVVRFEVASVKVAPPLDAAGFMVRPGSPEPGGRWSARNSTMLMLLQRAFADYDKPGMIVGGPDWLNERRFDIEARAVGSPTPAQYQQMLRLLLADRFSLKTRVEPMPVEVYSLIVARADGRLGPRLRPASPKCLAELEAERVRIANLKGPVSFSSDDAQPCAGATGVQRNSGLLRLAGGETLAHVAFGLEVFMDKRVVDQTGLKGIYEYDLEFDWNATRATALAPADDAAGGSVFTAVQEQLGLKLERRRETLDVLVIDAVAMPSEN